jgi:Putative auto-transporter adhesin, head GIN domain
LQHPPQYPAALLHHAFEKRCWTTGFQNAAKINSLFLFHHHEPQFVFFKCFITMKKFLAIIITALFISITANAQGGMNVLRGSGKLVTVTPDIANFDKIELNLHATTIIEVGKPNSIVLEIDDNLVKLLDVKTGTFDNTLTIKFKSIKRGWVESSNPVIRISVPTLTAFKQTWNGKTTINGVNGNRFRAENSGNGVVILRGSKIENLDLISDGNGEIDADNVTATNASVKANGNNNTHFNATNNYAAHLNGNGEIVNKGQGKATETSINGNGSIGDAYTVKSKNSDWKTGKSTEKVVNKTQKGSVQKVTISLRNNSPLPRKFMVISYEPSDNGGNGTNGVVIMPTFSKSFQFEVGTRIFIADSEQVDTVMGGKKLTGTPFLTVKAEDAGKIFSLNK